MEGFILLLVGTLTRQSKGIHLGGHVPIFMYGRHTMKNKKSVRTSNSLGSKTKKGDPYMHLGLRRQFEDDRTRYPACPALPELSPADRPNFPL